MFSYAPVTLHIMSGMLIPPSGMQSPEWWHIQTVQGLRINGTAIEQYPDRQITSYWPNHDVVVTAHQPEEYIKRLEFPQLIDAANHYWPPSERVWIQFRNRVATGVREASQPGYQLEYKRKGIGEVPVFTVEIRNHPIDGPIVNLLLPTKSGIVLVPRINSGRLNPHQLKTSHSRALTALVRDEVQRLANLIKPAKETVLV